MELPDPWDVADAMGAPSEDEVRREAQEDFDHVDPIEGVPCIICKTLVVMPRYEVTNLARGGEEMGVLCDDCGAKVTANYTERRMPE